MAKRILSGWGQLLELGPADDTRPSADQDRRLWVRQICNVPISYQPARVPEGEPLAARIRNISRRGVGLLVDRLFDPGAVLRVELPIGPACFNTFLLACVVYVKPEDDGHWALGCGFVDELTNEELKPFGAKRVEPTTDDLRAWVRYPCDAEASYRPMRVKKRQRRTARVVNLSVCGAALVVADPVELGTVLDLELKRQEGRAPLRMLACVVRVSQQGEQWTLGCNFIRQIGERELEALRGDAAASAMRESPGAEPPGR